MADNSNILITVTADSEGAITNINKVAGSVNAAGDSAKTFKQQIKELTNELQTTKIDKTSAEYQILKNRLSELKDAQKDFNEEIGANAGPAFESAGNNLRNLQSRLGSLDFGGAADSVKGLANNIKNLKFGGATDGAGAFGKSLLSLGKALLTNPLFLIGGTLALLITNFDKLAGAIPAVGIAFKALGDAVGFVKDLVVGFTDAIGLTQIKAGEAIDAAIGNRDRVNKELDNQRRMAVAKAQATGEDIETINKQFQDKRIADNKALIAEIDAQEQTGVKLTEKQLSERQKLIDENTEFAIVAAEKEGAAVLAARNEAARKEEKRLADEEAKRQKAAADAKARAEERKRLEKEVTDAINQSKEEQFQATLSAEEKELRQVALKYDQLKEKAGQNKELQKQIKEQELIELQAITDRYFEEELNKQAEQEAKKRELERAAAAQANIDRINKADSFFKLDRELEYKDIEAKNGRIQANREKAIDDLVAEYDEKFALANGDAAREYKLQEQQKKDLARLNAQYRTEQADADAQSNESRLAKFLQTSNAISQTAQDGLSTLVSLNEAFAGKSERSQKKAFERNKKLQIAQATVTTYQNAVAAASSQYVTGDPSSVVRAVIAAASAVAAGLANIAKIKATTFSSPAPSGGGGGGGTGGGGGEGGLASQGVASSGVPQFNPLSGLNLNQPQQIQPAYVLASDIASSMEARSKVQDLSRL